MPTPEFVLDLRRRIGHAPLPLVGVTAVVLHESRVLLGRRADNGSLAPVSGIVDPGEEPADAAVREAAEEAGVAVRAERLVWVHQMPRVTYGNGDRVDYLDLTFRCTWLGGDPHPADGELTSAGWFRLDDLAEVDDEHRLRIELAASDALEARFLGGSDPPPF